ncbi:hypothetical protein I6A60_12295 [Frankia sp. AgB1.9]|uniref:hypothetical protein n=1 Tax=unclassified Frankia TaxID=2632575 RepID=UPI001932D48C|nr:MULTISPECIES: hypothetical protein [unclassified Frankia]MBL7493262.1 hypothetical protein [Frankia sp. AgW1.1]MBL7548650.1 hypothetical protein [Frankia sp. AgB1.9]MBL7623509.1 hypothetical protein [Frankia sp. AgB1.8]
MSPPLSRGPIFWPVVFWVCGLYLTLAGLDGQLPVWVALLGVGLGLAGRRLRRGRS